MKLNIVFSIASLLFAAPLFAADAPPAPAADVPANPPAAKPEAAPKIGPKAAAFAKLNTEWSDLVANLAKISLEYPKLTDAAKKAELKKQYTEGLAKLSSMEEPFIEAAKEAFREAPNADAKISDLLVNVLADWCARDDLEKAFAVGKLLMDNKCDNSVVPGLAGLAAFSMNEFDTAETWLKQADITEARLRKIDDPRIQELLASVPAHLAEIAYYKDAWAKEKALRAAEAKADDLPRVLLKTTQGDIEVELFTKEAPNTALNFLTLVEKGFYKDVPFHRVLKHFMAQGGDPTGTGSGGPGYQIPAEFTLPEHRLHFRGTLAMARSKEPDSAGSQFFLMFTPNQDLDKNGYTVFGRMVKGIDVLAKIKRGDPQNNGTVSEPDKIIEAKVLRKGSFKLTDKDLKKS